MMTHTHTFTVTRFRDGRARGCVDCPLMAKSTAMHCERVDCKSVGPSKMQPKNLAPTCFDQVTSGL